MQSGELTNIYTGNSPEKISAGLGIGLRRHANTPDEHVVNVWIQFHAMVDHTEEADPSLGLSIDSIDIDLPETVAPSPGEELTEKEKSRVSQWFMKNRKRAEQAVLDQINSNTK